MNTASQHHDVARWRYDQLAQAGVPAPLAPAERIVAPIDQRTAQRR